MPRLYLVRHGEAAATWDNAADPGLSALGQTQAREAARTLVPLGPIAILSSPLARARETAMPLEAAWNRKARIADAVAEVPSAGIPIEGRRAWLMTLMEGRWADAAPELRAWAAQVSAFLVGLKEPAAIFSHYIAINVAVGAAAGDDAVVCFRPANASITILETDGARLRLIEKGAEAETIVR